MQLKVFYGGTFDPVHLGHIAIARTVADALQVPVHLVPSADPPHRPVPGASAEQRALMLDLAVGADRRLRVDRRELHRAGPSYTVDTLASIRGEVGAQTPVAWVLGMDALAGLAAWHDWKRLLSLAHLIGIERPEAPVEGAWLHERAPEVNAELEPRRTSPGQLSGSPAGAYVALPMHPLRPESATQVRQGIATGSDWDHLVPAAVAHHIRAHGLYGASCQP